MAHVEVHQRGRSFRVELGEVTVFGREDGCDVRLDDPTVSRRHAAIARTPSGTFSFADLGSSHGSFAGRARVQSVELEDGQELRLGDVRLVFVEEARAASASLRTSAGDDHFWLDVDAEPHFPPEREVSDVARLRRDYERLRATYQISRSIGTERDLGRLLDLILDAVFFLLPADRAAVILTEGGESAAPRRSRSRFGSDSSFSPSRTMIEQVIATKSAMLSRDTRSDAILSRAASICSLGIRSAMCVPLLYHDEVVGVLHADCADAVNAFSESDVELLGSIAAQAAMEIANATLGERIQRVTREEKIRLEQILRNLPTALLILDSDRRLVRSNPVGEAMLGALTSAREGEVVRELCGLELGELAAGCARGPVELELGGPRRRRVVVAAAGAAGAAGGSGARSELVFVIQDVTEVRDREAQAAQAMRLALVGQLAGGIAHDFNNLLCILLTAVGTLEQELRGAQVAELGMMRKAIGRGSGLVKQLLTFSRREEVTPRLVDLGEVVREATPILERALGRGHHLSFSLAPSLPMTFADPGQLEQILMNLVVNARDAMSEVGHVTISTSVLSADAPLRPVELGLGTWVELEVRDTGCGMPASVRERIFEPFFTTKAPGRGTGLGLATVYGIVKQANGAILVDSSPGAGTTFRVYLPAAAVERAPAEPAASSPGPQSGWAGRAA